MALTAIAGTAVRASDREAMNALDGPGDAGPITADHLQTVQAADGERRRAVWIPLITSAACTALVLAGALTLRRDEIVRRRIAATSEATVAIESALEARRQALSRMAKRWATSEAYGREIWREDARVYIKDLGAFQAIEWVDGDNVVRLIEPLAGNEVAQDLQLTLEGGLAEAVQRAMAERTHAVSKRVELVGRGFGVRDFHPIDADGRHLGFIVGVYRYNDLIKEAIATLGDQYAVSVWADGLLVHDAPGGAGGHPPAQAEVLELPGTRWHIHATPIALGPVLSRRAITVLAFGVLGAGLLGFCMNRALVARMHTRSVVIANLALQTLIDEVRHADARNRETEGRFQSVLDNASAVIYAKHLDGRYMLVNRRYTELFGLTAENLVGKTDYDVFPVDLADGYRRNDLIVAERGGPIQVEEDAPHADGVHHYVSTKFPLRDAGGAVCGVAGISTDITAILELQSDLEDKNADLERFVYTASHDLKSPIVTILGYTAHLVSDLEKNRSDDLLDFARRIRRAAERMRASVDDLLELSRIGRTVAAPQRIDLEPLIDALMETIAGEGRSGYDLSTDLEVKAIEMEFTQATQVFQNLLDNAIKYGCSGDDRRVEVRVTALEGGGVSICVRDHGPGIDAHHRERIFGLFERLSHDKTGTGIGLAIVRRVAQANGGQVTIEDTPGGGVTFRVDLRSVEPAADVSADVSAATGVAADVCS